MTDYDIVSKFEENVDAYISSREALKAQLQEKFKEYLEGLMRRYEITDAVIRGFTPGFNDGDPCTYSFYCEYIDDIEYVFETKFGLGTESENLIQRVSPGVLNDNISWPIFMDKIYRLESLAQDIFPSVEIYAAIDTNGAFHYYSDDDYDCGY